MNILSKPSGLRSIIVIALVALLLLGGIGITGVAAQSAIPGDALYTVKTSIEQARLSLAKDASDRAQLALDFAEERLVEISALVQEGRTREIKNAVISFEASINRAIIELETVAKGDPARATELAQEITSALTRYAQTLSVLAASAPDSILNDVNRALDSTNLAGSFDTSSFEDNSNGNDNASDDNGNDNISDDNGNDDTSYDNGNDNTSYDNGNDNTSYDNGNDNDNDDNGNNNASDDDGNDNDSDDSGNDNDSDDSGNDNSNSNDNTNSSGKGNGNGGG